MDAFSRLTPARATVWENFDIDVKSYHMCISFVVDFKIQVVLLFSIDCSLGNGHFAPLDLQAPSGSKSLYRMQTPAMTAYIKFGPLGT